jgi:hypothetical protein
VVAVAQAQWQHATRSTVAYFLFAYCLVPMACELQGARRAASPGLVLAGCTCTRFSCSPPSTSPHPRVAVCPVTSTACCSLQTCFITPYNIFMCAIQYIHVCHAVHHVRLFRLARDRRCHVQDTADCTCTWCGGMCCVPTRIYIERGGGLVVRFSGEAHGRGNPAGHRAS